MASTEISFIPDFDQLDRDIQDEDFQATVDMEGESGGVAGGGTLQPSERNQQESIVAGGVSKGLLAAGVFAGILSQLESVTAIVSAVFGAISRALVPIVEDLADFIRPLVDFANRAATNVGSAASTSRGIGQALAPFLATGGTVAPGFGTRTTSVEELPGPDNRPEFIDNFVDSVFGTNTADQSDEAKKHQLKQNSEDAGRDILGAFR